MNIRLAYGKSGLDVTLPDGHKVDVVRPKYVEALADQAEAVRDALRRPIGSPPLRELVKPSDTVGIVCNDITRPTPYGTILPVLLEELSHVPDGAITFLIANGTHRAGAPEELRTVLGEEIVDRFRVVQNDAYDRDTHAPVGTTADGNEVWIHKEYLRCDVRILTGFIEPHFFVGFSGGGKACMPGLAGLETILRNHCARNMDHPGATWAVTYGNPIWEGIREAALLAAPTFLLNVTLNRDKQITGVFAGDMDQAHERGCAFVKEHALAPVAAPYDIVITSSAGSPLDLNLYQAVKGMSAAARIVKKGGAIMVAADCWDGIPDHGQYKRLLFEAADHRSLLEKVRADNCHCQDAWQAQIHAQVCEKANVYLFSHNLTDEQIERALLKPCRDVAGTVEQLLRVHGRDASICVLPEGPQTIPYIVNAWGGANDHSPVPSVKIVVALDSFKGSLTAVQACDIAARAIRAVVPGAQVVTKPMADGGEGTASVLMAAAGGQWIRRTVCGPLPEMEVEAGFVWMPDSSTALVEMATASGLPLLRPEQRNPLKTTTYGTGQLIRMAFDHGAKHILLAIGGSATVDGGVGAAMALGWRFLTKEKREIDFGGDQLRSVERIVAPPDPLDATVEVLCDVDNPLCGEHGAARVYGPQKGATPEMVEQLDAGLAHLARVVKEQLGRDIACLPGAGAAGGLAAGAVAFMNARLVPGIDAIMSQTCLAEAVVDAGWVVTGEGSFDEQSLRGKVVSGVARVARDAGAKVAVCAGQVRLEPERYRQAGIDTAVACMGVGMELEYAIVHGAELLDCAARQFARDYLYGKETSR